MAIRPFQDHNRASVRRPLHDRTYNRNPLRPDRPFLGRRPDRLLDRFGVRHSHIQRFGPCPARETMTAPAPYLHENGPEKTDNPVADLYHRLLPLVPTCRPDLRTARPHHWIVLRACFPDVADNLHQLGSSAFLLSSFRLHPRRFPKMEIPKFVDRVNDGVTRNGRASLEIPFLSGCAVVNPTYTSRSIPGKHLKTFEMSRVCRPRQPARRLPGTSRLDFRASRSQGAESLAGALTAIDNRVRRAHQRVGNPRGDGHEDQQLRRLSPFDGGGGARGHRGRECGGGADDQ